MLYSTVEYYTVLKISSNTDESHEHNVFRKDVYKKEYILHDSIYMKLKLIFDVRSYDRVTSGRRKRVIIGRGEEQGF